MYISPEGSSVVYRTRRIWERTKSVKEYTAYISRFQDGLKLQDSWNAKKSASTIISWHFQICVPICYNICDKLIFKWWKHECCNIVNGRFLMYIYCAVSLQHQNIFSLVSSPFLSTFYVFLGVPKKMS